MKKRKIAKAALALLSVLMIGAGGASLAACGDNNSNQQQQEQQGNQGNQGNQEQHVHAYGSWTITQAPTLTAPGKAKHKCDADNYEQEIEIPALSDSAVWTVKSGSHVDPTHSVAGKDVYTSVYGEVEIVLPANADAHSYGDWSFVEGELPTWDKEGRIQRSCVDTDAHAEAHVDYMTVPALSNTGFWAMETVTPASHQTGGKADFTNAEYNLTVTGADTPKEAHTFADWVIDTEPTADTAGAAHRVCTRLGCKEDPTATEELELPALTDATFWTIGTTIPATYFEPAYVPYSNAEHDITIYVAEGTKLPAPYDGKTYLNAAFTRSEGSSSVSVYVRSSALTVGDDSVGTGEGYPFRGTFEFELVELVTPEMGKVQITNGDTSMDAYVDIATGVLVVAVSDWAEPFVLVPADTIAMDDFKASSALGHFLIEYKDDTVPNILIVEDEVYFGVTITDIFGEELAGDCFAAKTANAVLVTAGDVVFSYAFDGENWVETDGLEGVYTLDDGRKVVVNGANQVAILSASDEELFSGTYAIVGEGKIGVVVDGEYNEYALSNDGTCTEVKNVKVTITFDFNGYTPANAPADLSQEVNKGIPMTLQTNWEHATMHFMGWYKDADCTQPVELVDGKYIPMASTTLYAKWGNKVVITLVGVLDGDLEEIRVGISDDEEIYFSDILPAYVANVTVDRINGKKFVGWFIDSVDGTPLNLNAVVAESDNGMQLFAKWETCLPVEGSYIGFYLLARASTDGTMSVTSGKSLVITNGVVVEGSEISGKTIVMGEGNTTFTADTYYGVFDPANGVLAYLMSSGSTDFNGAFFIMFADREQVTLTENSTSYWPKSRLLQFTFENDEKFNVFVYDSKIYFGVSFTSEDGEVAAGEAYKASQISVYDRDGKLIADFVQESRLEGLKPTDGLRGDYTLAGGTDVLHLDGFGALTINGDEHVGEYTIAADDAGYTLEVYLDERTEYIRITLNDDGTYTSVRPTVRISFVSEHGGEGEVDANINVVYKLPTPASTDTLIFVGWYFDEGCTSQPVEEGWIPQEGQTYTMYAKWEVKVIVTVYFYTPDADPEEPELLEFAQGKEVTLEPVENDDYIFEGWYKTYESSSGEFGEKYEDNKLGELNNPITVYGKWVKAASMRGTYNGWNIFNDKDNGTKTVKSATYTFEIKPNGTYSGSQVSTGGTLSKDDLYVSSGAINIGRYAYVDLSVGVIWYGWSSNDSSVGNDTLLMFNPNIVKQISYSGKKTNPYTFWATVEFVDETKPNVNIFGYNNIIYVGVTLSNGATPLTAYDKTHIVYGSDGNPIAGYKNGAFVELDEYAGTYDVTKVGEAELGFTQLTLDGIGFVEIDGVTGTYNVIDGGKISLTFDDAYYEITAINTSDKTCSVTKPMTTVKYNSDKRAVEDESRNTNITFDLPEVEDTDEYAFRGWYTQDGSENGDWGTEIKTLKPTGEEVVVYARWELILHITVVYGNTLENETIEGIASGDVLTLENKGLVNGKVVDTYTISGSPWTNGSAVVSETANVTINVDWIDAHVLYGTYSGVDAYWFGTSSKVGVAGQVSSSVLTDKKLTIDAYGKISAVTSAQVSVGNIVTYEEATGELRIGPESGNARYGYADADNGILIYTYYSSSSSDSFASEVRLLILARGDGNTMTKSDICYWNNRDAILFTIKNGDDATHVFFYKNTIYYNVTYTSSAGTFAAGEAYNKADIKIVTADGKTFEFVQGADGFLSDPDGYQGEYTGNFHGSDDSITLNSKGGGKFTVGDDSTLVDYTILSENKLTFIYNNRMFVITVNKEGNSFEQIADGYEGTYTLPSGDPLGTTLTIDGYGCAGDGITYVASGKNISIFTSSGEVKYIIDVDADTLAGLPFNVEGKTPTGTGKVFSYDASEDAWLTAAEQYGDAYVAIEILASGTLTFSWKAMENGSDGDWDCQFRYDVYNTADGTKKSSNHSIGTGEARGSDFSSLAWKSASIKVEAGTTIYICFNRAFAGSKAQAGIKDISLNVD